MENKFEIGSLLGKGGFASVYLARSVKSRQKVAIKVINVSAITDRRASEKGVGDQSTNLNQSRVNCDEFTELRPSLSGNNQEENSLMQMVKREIDVHTSISPSRHPNIVALFESFYYWDPQLNSQMVSLVMEHCSRGDLQSYLKRIRDQRRQHVSKISQQQMNDSGRRDSSRGDHRNILLQSGTFLCNDEIKHALADIFRGLSFLHSRGIVHRDIKASNVFLCPLSGDSLSAPISSFCPEDEYAAPNLLSHNTSDNKSQFSLLNCQLKLGDFGLAVQMNDDDDWYEAQHTLCGTPSYLAPEVALSMPLNVPDRKTEKKATKSVILSHDEFDSLDFTEEIDTIIRQNQGLEKSARGYGQPADLWSAGCLLYTMIVGRNPFSSPNSPPSPCGDPNHHKPCVPTKIKRLQETIDRVTRGEWSVPSYVSMNSAMKALLNQLLAFQPNKRGTARSILSFHPFFMANRSPPMSPLVGAQSRPSDEYQVIPFDTSSKAVVLENPTNEKLIHPVGSKQGDCVQSMANTEASPETYFLSPKIMDSAVVSLPQTFNDTERIIEGETRTISSLTHQNSTYFDHDKSRSRTGYESQNSFDMDSKACHPGLDQFGTTNNTVRSDGLELSCRSLIPMKALHRLPPAKYRWEEALGKTGNVRQYTVFILAKYGLVIRRQEPDYGLWMHIASDGLRVLSGRVERELEGRMKRTSTLRRTQSQLLLDEAFSCSIRYLFNSKTLDALTPSSTVPISSHRPDVPIIEVDSLTEQAMKGIYSYHKPLSLILCPSYEEILSLYRSLERVINIVKASTPKITLYLYTVKSEFKNQLEQSNATNHSLLEPLRLFAKAMLMENNPLANIEISFVDGIKIHHDTSSGHYRIKPKEGKESNHDTEVKTCQFSSTNEIMYNDPTKNGYTFETGKVSQKFAHHLNIAQGATQECLKLEKYFDSQDPVCEQKYRPICGDQATEGLCHFDNFSDLYPIVKRAIIYGYRTDQWVICS